jgi:XTP/dITP diphosphohydrolase
MPTDHPTPLMTVVLASHNRGKLAELRELFRELPVDLVAVGELLPTAEPVPETGDTFEENAFLKARAIAELTQLVTIADDSGLEVDALGGRPGVRSARYAREGATDAENNAALLEALREVEDPARTARFRCVMAMVDPFAGLDAPVYAAGACEGVIANSPMGESGFGYDPLFVVAESSEPDASSEGPASATPAPRRGHHAVGRTYAELDEDTKNSLSHRGRAARALRPMLAELVERRCAEARRVLEEG